MRMSAPKTRIAVLAALAAFTLSVGCSSGSGDVPPPPTGLHYLTNPATYAVGVAIPANLPAASGGAATSFSVSPALPAGLGLDAATGVISGTPSAATATPPANRASARSG